MEITVPRLPANGNFNRDSAYPAKRPQNSEIAVAVLFGAVYTATDLGVVYVLTGGGPANATQLFATYAYQLGIGTGLLSEGATISLAVFPVLLLVVIVQLLYIRRVETH